MLFQITVQVSLFSVLYMQNYIINFKNERMGGWNIEKMWEGLTADVFIQSFSRCCVIRSSYAKVGTVRLSSHALSVKYFVLTAHNISRWKTIIPNRSLDGLLARNLVEIHHFDVYATRSLGRYHETQRTETRLEIVFGSQVLWHDQQYTQPKP